MEQNLGAQESSDPVDNFLRDLLRWRIGKSHGKNRSYEVLQRWMHTNKARMLYDYANDRMFIGHNLCRLSKLYGILTGTSGKHPNEKVERELRHLPAMGIHTHRPLTLRLLSDVEMGVPGATIEALVQVLHAIGTWITRLWFIGSPMSGINTSMAIAANSPEPTNKDEYVNYWIGHLRKHRNTKIGVPTDEIIRSAVH